MKPLAYLLIPPTLASLLAAGHAQENADRSPPTGTTGTASLFIEEGPLNAIEIARGDRRLAINRSIREAPELLLLTHVRRDTIQAARSSHPAELAASVRSEPFLDAEAHWEAWEKERFDYYGQQVRQWPLFNPTVNRLLPLPEAPAQSTSLEWQGLEIVVLDTPGYTRDGTTYLIDLEGKRHAFVGDLVLAGGQVRDLYSFQDEIRPAKIGGYHGYLGRLGRWIESLRAVADAAPDVLVPSRGPISTTPGDDIERAIDRARKIYRNYLSTNALHWYFGEERMNTCAELVLGKNHGVASMPLAEHVELPEWCHHIGTTKLLVSRSGSAFALDVGGPRSLETLKQLHEQGLIRGLDGIFVTHTHNDHTAAVAEAARHFEAPVYALPEVADVLLSPGSWFLPGVSPNAVDEVTVMQDGQAMKWEEYDFTFRFFPGQMYRHGALLVEREDHAPIFFIGDSFSPSGIDDYCMMNRNLMREDTGYLSCFRTVRKLPQGTWLVNQHIPHLFRFTGKELDWLESQYRERIRMIGDFCPVGDANYAVDEQWARFHPYSQVCREGEDITTSLVLENHASSAAEFTVTIRWGDIVLATKKQNIAGRSTGSIAFDLKGVAARNGKILLTADIARGEDQIREGHCETFILVPGYEDADSPEPR